MSVPINYKNSLEYLQEVTDFLQNYYWLISIPNTHILSNNLLKNFPEDWREIISNHLTLEELNNIPFGYINNDWPKSLQNFICKIESFKPKIDYEIGSLLQEETANFFKGLKPKKIHEILAFAPFIHENCLEFQCEIIVDIGAGLGYLPQLLFQKYGYNILAIESNEFFVKTAQKRQTDLYKNSINHIKYVHHYVDENSSDFLENLLEKYHKKRICLIGLHACADLSITLFKLFSKMSCVSLAIVMPCCYHRLKKLENNECFENFPVSSVFRNIYREKNGATFLNGAFLRLACQNTGNSWKNMTKNDHETHSVGALRRSILQMVIDKEGYHLRRLKRKTQHLSEINNFQNYLNNLKQTHSITDPKNLEKEIINSDNFIKIMTTSWELHKKDCQLIEFFTALQVSLQTICENIILLDRIEMVKEWGFVSFARKITNDGVSPRCYATVAIKQNKS